MELVYYWINKDNCINEKGFCFSPEYSISMLKSKEEIYEVRLEKKKIINIFASEVISNLTVLVGDNGPGKSTFLRNILSINCYPLEKSCNEEYRKYTEEWNDNVISKEIQLFLKKEEATTPLEILRTHKIPEVNDEIIDNGFKELLEEAYIGNLSLDEYVLFISNCHYSRSCGLNLPKIDWEKVREGIRQQIKYLVKSDEKDNHFHRMIDDNSEEYFTEEEWSAYQIIKEFRDNDVWIYEKNQRLYIDLISSNLIRAFRDLGNKRYNKFSFEMESATIDAFKNATNANKNHFSGWFVGIWGQYSNSSEIDGQVTMMSLKKLRDDLNFIMQEYKEKNMNIAAMHTQNFIKKLDAIIKPENEDLQTRQVIQ